MDTSSCPKCGSSNRNHGKIYQTGTLNDIRFKSDEAPALSLKKPVLASACAKCGYIELFLSEHETGDAV